VVKTECLHGVSLRGGPRSEMGLRFRRERECVRGSRSRSVRSGSSLSQWAYERNRDD